VESFALAGKARTVFKLLKLLAQAEQAAVARAGQK